MKMNKLKLVVMFTLAFALLVTVAPLHAFASSDVTPDTAPYSIYYTEYNYYPFGNAPYSIFKQVYMDGYWYTGWLYQTGFPSGDWYYYTGWLYR